MSMTAQIAEIRYRSIAYRPEFGTRPPVLTSAPRPHRPEVPATDVADQHAFEIMARTYSADLLRFACWLCRNRWQAQDLVQETFVAAWKGWKSLRDRGATKAWLFSILRNEHTRVHRKKQLDLTDIDLNDVEVAGGRGEMERVELEESLRALPEHLREPLLLQVLGGFSGKEIAGMLNISEPNVMTRLKRARDALYHLATPRGSNPAMT
jgi:RNA polymerase sigma-70 factor, ECF subfamily